MVYSPPGSSIHGILQAGILEWVAISFSRGSSHPGIEPRSPVLQADTLTSEPPGSQYHQPSGLTGLESTSLWAAYHDFSHTWAFQNLQNSSKILLCVSIDGETGPCPTAASDSFFLPGPIASHFSN